MIGLKENVNHVSSRKPYRSRNIRMLSRYALLPDQAVA